MKTILPAVDLRHGIRRKIFALVLYFPIPIQVDADTIVAVIAVQRMIIGKIGRIHLVTQLQSAAQLGLGVESQAVLFPSGLIGENP